MDLPQNIKVNGNVIRVVYEIDAGQQKDLSYTVHHVVEGETEPRDIFTEGTTVQVLQPDTITRNLEKEADQEYTGYVKTTVTYEDGTEVPADVTKINNGAVLIVNYIVDEEQTKDLSYTVRHVVEGETEPRNTFTEETTVQVLQPDTITRNLESEADQKYTGYVKTTVTYEDGTEVPADVTKIADGTTLIVNYAVDKTQRKDLGYTIRHVVNGEIKDIFTEIANVQVLEPDTLARNLEKEADQNYAGYTKDTVTYADGTAVTDDVTRIENETIIIVSYKENADVTVNYVSEDINKGTVSLASETIAPATGNPDGSKATAADGYVFTHWTNSKGETVATTVDYKPVKNPESGVFEADTYTAHFTERGDLSYRVEYYFDGVLGNTVAQDNVKFGTDIAYITTPQSYKGNNYVFEKTEGPKTVGAVSEQNVLKVYYTLDATGTDKPGTPDGVPDKFQITFTYVANSNGSVSGTTVEVHTIQEFERDAVTGEITKVGEVKPASPKADVTASGNGRYTFSYWSIRGNADKTYSKTADLRNDAFVKDVTFAANFKYVGGGGGGGDHGNNGGNPSYKPDNNGPGTTPIGPGEVPLAMLPDTQSPADMMIIDDGEIPLAALPKTGQASVRGTLTMMLSGIMLAITALNKKRKEEEDS